MYVYVSVPNCDSYPLPRIDDLLASLAGGMVFSKLDLSHAYFQLTLAEESKKFVTISTHKGLFQYNRMPFGEVSATSDFPKKQWKGSFRAFHMCTFILMTFSCQKKEQN